MTDAAAFAPDWVSPPGETISELLQERGLTQADLAARTGTTRKHINDLVRGRAPITSDTALKLETVLGSTATFWLTRESQYREALSRRAKLETLRLQSPWLAELPLPDMCRLGWVRRFSHKGQQVEECLRFFRVASLSAWREVYEKPLAAYRISGKARTRVGSLAAWIREGERRAEATPCAPFDRDLFRRTLSEARSLTLEADPASFVPRLTADFASCGVAIAFLPAPAACPASGATRWLSPTKAMLLLSLRYKTNDHLWFTFFHEAAHLLLHGKKLLFLEGQGIISDQLEPQADRFARDFLIHQDQTARLKSLGYSKEAVIAFAHDIGIAPGIVVGRLQKEELLPWTHLNNLKVSYRWT